MKNTLMKIVLMMMSIMMVISLCACGSEEEAPEASPTMPPVVTAEPDKVEEPDTDTTEPEPTPEETPAPTYGLVEESEAVDLAYFDDTAFVGDSVSLKLSYYSMASGALGNAQFFTAGSLSCANALWEISDESVHPSYQGEKTLVEDCVAKSGVKKVYIMLGMNDIGLYGIDKTIENYTTLVGKIKEKSTEVEIIVQSMTPMTTTSNIVGKNLNNDNIKVYNSRLLELCEEQGWYFVDVASVMYDASGQALVAEYCSDPNEMGVHFTEEGCKVWVDYLLKHAVK